jgi:hypothetical protein
MKFDDTLMKAVRHDLDNNLIPMLLGEPGIGKSSWTEALADLMHTKCFTLACNQLADKADLTGARLVPVLDADGNTVSYKQVFYPHAVISDAIAYAKENPRETPILFMDEMNRTTPDVTSECLSIPTLRSIGSVQLPNNLRVMLAGNDKGNVTSLDEASISRFALYHVTPDVDTFLGLNQNLNQFVKNVLTAHPECIFCKTTTTVAGNDDDSDEQDIEEIIDDGEDMLQITTPRTISAVSKWLNSFTNQELMALLAETHTVNDQEVSALQEILEGHIGNTVFCSFLLAEITSGIMTTNNQATALHVGKPACYDDFKNCASMSELNDFVASMTDNDKSGCLLYAIYEKADNANYIKALAPAVTMLESSDMKVLMQLITADSLDAENVHTLLSTDTTIADRLSVILEA